MRDFPQELVFALVFGAVWLAQLVYKFVRRKAAALQPDGVTVPVPVPLPESVSEVDTRPPPVRLRPDRQDLHPRVDDPPRSADAPWTAPAPAAVRVRSLPSGRRLERRFSKATLMPDRRAVQDAIVIAAILQPCHAQRPPDVG